MSQKYEHLVNPEGRTLSADERRYREAVVEHEIEAATRRDEAIRARTPAPPPAAEHEVPTRLELDESGGLRRPDGSLVEHEPGAASQPRTMPRVGEKDVGINARMRRHQDDASGA